MWALPYAPWAPSYGPKNSLTRFLPFREVAPNLDPPFKSNQTYNVLFQGKDGSQGFYPDIGVKPGLLLARKTE